MKINNVPVHFQIATIWSQRCDHAGIGDVLLAFWRRYARFSDGLNEFGDLILGKSSNFCKRL